ncbi:TAF1 transcription initiation factor TFIID subunit TAF1 [Russula ochroleuca]|uniref:TAF1 transcription initiation factor TFIID subunit TAF1 n=1 Tax=Russula ochroleuca TaxID=152965 RepID=A0A9P5MYE3_9AGAM|nr:TAF1 transcription initiation factor TFIID subunit TAF1 [Russula ochroleuca]
MSNEDDAVSALTGFSLDHVLSDLSIPSTGLSNKLGISGIPTLSSSQIYNEKWDKDDGAVGAGEGEDFEDEVDRELKEEEEEDDSVKMEFMSPVGPFKQRRVRVIRRLVERPKTVYERFPSFEKNKVLDFTELFQGFAVKKSRVVKRPIQLESVYPKKRDIPKNFLDVVVGDTKRQVENERVEEVVSSGSIDHDLRAALERKHGGVDTSPTIPLHDRSFDLVLLSSWEDQITYEPENDPRLTEQSRTDLMAPVNKALEAGAWTQSIIWGPRTPFRDFTQIEFNNGDDIIPEERPPAHEVRPRKRLRFDNAQVKDKFNLSNDQFYDVSKDGGRHRVRQTFGDLVVEHAYPAQKLQLPFYKTRLGKQESRSFHRPALQIPANIEIRFTKVRSAKKKKDKTGRRLGRGGNVGENLRRTSDLSLRDTSNYVLWEFSEEHPPIIGNFGMGSILVNYYRKKSEKDEHIPKGDLGEPFVLEPQDESPFMKFGYVQPGQTIPALYSNLIRAPLFRHKGYPTDFLVIKNTVKGESKYFIREIKNLFVVGQTYPVTEVPGPHSRKITNTIKHRLQVIAYKLLAKSPGERLKISRLMKYFPDQNELQMRQRLKEFMEYHRRGPHQGFWRLKPNWVVPNKTEMLKMVGPEQIVLSESMQVGQRHLQDAGYSGTQDTGGDDDDSHLSIEQQLAPWITTKNFIFATQAKAMLRLHGDGDPTGRGEAFSFIRVSMKDIFVKAGEDYEQKLAEAENRPKSAHRYNVAEQQLIYKSEIERIWKAQFASLSRKDEPQLSDDEDDRKSLPPQRMARKESRALSPATALTGPAVVASPGLSRASSIDRDRDVSVGPDGGRRVLRIKRFIDDKWCTEIVRDAAVIRAYIRRRQIIEDETTGADTLAPTGDIDRDLRAKKRLEEEIARMKKNQERRLHRKNAKIAKEGGTLMTLNRPIKPDTTRRCGHCGQMGHMKTNRKCPRWAEFNSATQPPATPTPVTASASGSAGSPPPLTPSLSNSLGLGQSSSLHVPSPLATSPPVIAAAGDVPTAPKIKLTLKR